MQPTDDHASLRDQAGDFLDVLSNWKRDLQPLAWSSLSSDIQQGRVALFCIDMVNGFCHAGALASPRITDIIPEVVSIFEKAYEVGMRDFILAQDCHPADSLEFADFPPHCQVGTAEADNIAELAQLPFADAYTTIYKNSLNAFHGTTLAEWLESHSDLSTIIFVGNCTDLCVYQTAMHARLSANAVGRTLRVLVPENAVQTYDMSIETAKKAGALPHNGDLLHLIFLYHMRLNGIEIVRELL